MSLSLSPALHKGETSRQRRLHILAIRKHTFRGNDGLVGIWDKGYEEEFLLTVRVQGHVELDRLADLRLPKRTSMPTKEHLNFGKRLSTTAAADLLRPKSCIFSNEG